MRFLEPVSVQNTGFSRLFFVVYIVIVICRTHEYKFIHIYYTWMMYSTYVQRNVFFYFKFKLFGGYVMLLYSSYSIFILLWSWRQYFFCLGDEVPRVFLCIRAYIMSFFVLNLNFFFVFINRPTSFHKLCVKYEKKKLFEWLARVDILMTVFFFVVSFSLLF